MINNKLILIFLTLDTNIWIRSKIVLPFLIVFLLDSIKHLSFKKMLGKLVNVFVDSEELHVFIKPRKLVEKMEGRNCDRFCVPEKFGSQV